MRDELGSVLEENNLPASADRLDKLREFYRILMVGNEKANLTTLTTPAEYIYKHVLDSLLPATMYPFSNAFLLDIGTGGGFPGLPLKIVFPEIKLTLVEAVAKKVDFLRHCCKELSVEAEILWGRAELLGKGPRRGTFDGAITRAVAGLSVICEYSLPLLKLHGHCLAMKGPSGGEEVAGAENALRLLGGSLEGVYRYRLPPGDRRSLIIIKKTAQTPLRYPRKAGTPSKRPL